MNYWFFCALLCLQTGWLYAEIDLETNPHDFVLETKKIEIAEFPHAFNPSIVRVGDKILMSFRAIPNPQDPYVSYIYLVWLDETFNPISSPQKLDLRRGLDTPCRTEDSRLIFIQDRLHMVYSDNIDPIISGGGFRMFITEIAYNGTEFFSISPERISEWEGANPNRREKNWVPFNHKDQLLLAYGLTPHLILRPIYGTESCQTIALAKNNIQWDWGELRGGTPATLIDDEYLAFFHSQKKMSSLHSGGKEMLHYFMGAYTFTKERPFHITKISPEPIWGKNFYKGQEYKRYWGSVRVIFPCGFISDEKFIWVSYGRQDHELWIAKLDKKGLLNSLVPLHSSPSQANL